MFRLYGIMPHFLKNSKRIQKGLMGGFEHEVGCFLIKLEFLSLFFLHQRRSKPFDISTQSQQTLELGQTQRTNEE